VNDLDARIREALEVLAEPAGSDGVLDDVRVGAARRHRRRLIVGLVGVIAVVGGASSAWIGTRDSPSTQVVAGPGGTRPHESSLRLEPGGNGFGVALDETGVWVTTGTVSEGKESWSVVHVDPTGQEVLARIPLPASPAGVATGAGAVWVTTLSERDGPLYGTLVRIDPTTDTVTATLPLEVAGGVAVTNDAVWVTAPSLGSLYRVDPRTATLVATIPDLGASFVTVAFDRVWVTNVHGGNLIEIDPTSNQVVGTTAVGELPAWLVGTGDSLWVTLQQPPAVARIDPTDRTMTATVSAPARIVAISADEEQVWIGTNESGTDRGAIYRIDATTNEVEPFDAFESTAVTDLVVDRDALWAVSYRDGILFAASIDR
jgi:sugar lactone lactonase YvrE